MMTLRAQRMPLPESMAVFPERTGATRLMRVQSRLARSLIALAWKRSLATGAAVKPWPWAQMFPVARLTALRQGAELMVMAGASKHTLVFGAGHIDGTPFPGDPGNAVLSGRRDSHFAFLRELRSGDALLVHAASGRLVHYVVSGIEVVRSKDVRVLLDAGDDRLTLVTGYPFDGPLAGTSLRYVVVAMRRDAAVTRI
jgi:sortase A